MCVCVCVLLCIIVCVCVCVWQRDGLQSSSGHTPSPALVALADMQLLLLWPAAPAGHMHCGQDNAIPHITHTGQLHYMVIYLAVLPARIYHLQFIYGIYKRGPAGYTLQWPRGTALLPHTLLAATAAITVLGNSQFSVQPAGDRTIPADHRPASPWRIPAGSSPAVFWRRVAICWRPAITGVTECQQPSGYGVTVDLYRAGWLAYSPAACR